MAATIETISAISLHSPRGEFRNSPHLDFTNPENARAMRDALRQVHSQLGTEYDLVIGGHNEQRNIDVVRRICELLERFVPATPGRKRFEDLITFVSDRPGHDTRYAIDASKIGRDLGWKPLETFESGLEKTVHWYLENREWWQRVLDGSYRLERIGMRT